MPAYRSAESRLRAQNAATSTLAHASSLTEAAPGILAAISDGLGWELGALWSVDRHRGELRAVSVWHADTIDASEFEGITRHTAFARGAGIPGRAWEEGGPIWINDVAALARSDRVRNTARLGLHAAFAFPIVLTDGVLGVIEFFSRDVREPDDALLELMASIGSQLGQFIQRKEAEQAARVADERFRALADSAVGLWQLDVDGRTTYLNDTMCAMLEIAGEHDLAERTIGSFLSPESMVDTERPTHAGEGRASHGLEVELVGAQGGHRHAVMSAAPLFSPGGAVASRLHTFIDVTDRQTAQDRLAYLAYHDEVTGLPNRAMLMEHLELAIARADRSGQAVAALFVDIDDFRLINDGFGRAAGNELLHLTAERLRRVTRTADVVARQSADEFLVLIADLQVGGDGAGLADAVQIAEAVGGQIRHALEAPFTVTDNEVYVGVSTGVATFPGHSHDAESLLRAAHVAMEVAREAGRSGTSIAPVDPTRRLTQTTRLRRAVDRQEFVLHYQPIVELATGQIRSVEALIRWDDPEQGIVPPADFIPLAERIGMIAPISDWVVAEACAQAERWRRAGIRLDLSVNLPPVLWQPAMIRKLLATVQSRGVRPDELMIEITESAAMIDPDRTLRILRELAGHGFTLAIDDFGTGYSSLSRLKQMPVSTLKIDRSFVRDLPHDPHSVTLVGAIIQLAASLGLVPLAEGVETPEQLAFLIERGCPLGQGFHFSPPVTPAEIERIVRVERRAA